MVESASYAGKCSFLWKLRQYFSKIRYRRELGRRAATSLSDKPSYIRACEKACIGGAPFNNFRRQPAYNEILEHIPPALGAEYLAIIERDPSLMKAMCRFKENDAYGNPRLNEYPPYGNISPTTLRYVKVLYDLKRHFQTLDDLKICEIGVGYGGQCRVINAYFRPAHYCLIDLDPALKLAKRYLENYPIASVLSYKTMAELEACDYDLVISNYAFSELTQVVQDEYYNKTISKSARGYLTYNEITPPGFRSYRAADLLRIIPQSISVPEEPPTHPDNCIIIWGSLKRMQVDGDGCNRC